MKYDGKSTPIRITKANRILEVSGDEFVNGPAGNVQIQIAADVDFQVKILGVKADKISTLVQALGGHDHVIKDCVITNIWKRGVDLRNVGGRSLVQANSARGGAVAQQEPNPVGYYFLNSVYDVIDCTGGDFFLTSPDGYNQGDVLTDDGGCNGHTVTRLRALPGSKVWDGIMDVKSSGRYIDCYFEGSPRPFRNHLSGVLSELVRPSFGALVREPGNKSMGHLCAHDGGKIICYQAQMRDGATLVKMPQGSPMGVVEVRTDLPAWPTPGPVTPPPPGTDWQAEAQRIQGLLTQAQQALQTAQEGRQALLDRVAALEGILAQIKAQGGQIVALATI